MAFSAETGSPPATASCRGGLRVVQAVDSAFKTGVSADFSVIATWETDGTNFYLVDIWRRRVEFPELVRQVAPQALEYRPGEILIEDAASGQSAVQELRLNTSLPIIAVRPEASKERAPGETAQPRLGCKLAYHMLDLE